MHQAKYYSKNNGLQRYDAAFVIENFIRLVKWKKNEEEKILDIGCGDGSVTVELLLPRIPNQELQVIGCDISQEMVDFAKERCGKAKGFRFMKLDISAEEVPEDMKNCFNHIFSFYCFHWIQKQRKAFENVYEMLIPKGEILLTFLASNPIFDIYESMAKINKWKPYMYDLKKYISPYHHSEDPEKELESLMSSVGFAVHLCRVELRNYTFPNIEILKKSIKAICPFIDRIPENEVNDYIDDCMTEVKKLKKVDILNCNNNNEEKFVVNYKLFVVFASKQPRK